MEPRLGDFVPSKQPEINVDSDFDAWRLCRVPLLGTGTQEDAADTFPVLSGAADAVHFPFSKKQTGQAESYAGLCATVADSFELPSNGERCAVRNASLSS
jgi:hypothetical protein